MADFLVPTTFSEYTDVLDIELALIEYVVSRREYAAASKARGNAESEEMWKRRADETLAVLRRVRTGMRQYERSIDLLTRLTRLTDPDEGVR